MSQFCDWPLYPFFTAIDLPPLYWQSLLPVANQTPALTISWRHLPQASLLFTLLSLLCLQPFYSVAGVVYPWSTVNGALWIFRYMWTLKVSRTHINNATSGLSKLYDGNAPDELPNQSTRFSVLPTFSLSVKALQDERLTEEGIFLRNLFNRTLLVGLTPRGLFVSVATRSKWVHS